MKTIAVSINPVRAGLIERAEQWRWASARAHALGEADPLLDPARPFAAGARDALTGRPLAWGAWLAQGVPKEETEAIRHATRTGRPCGDEAFVRDLEVKLARALLPLKRGRKSKPSRDAKPLAFFDE